MTREEEIKLVADCHIADSIENYKEFYEGFIHGAKWADENPKEGMVKMRKFYVRYEYCLGGPQYGNIIITLEANEKANLETFNKKLMTDMGGVGKRVLAWSLIED